MKKGAGKGPNVENNVPQPELETVFIAQNTGKLGEYAKKQNENLAELQRQQQLLVKMQQGKRPALDDETDPLFSVSNPSLTFRDDEEASTFLRATGPNAAALTLTPGGEAPNAEQEAEAAAAVVAPRAPVSNLPNSKISADLYQSRFGGDINQFCIALAEQINIRNDDNILYSNKVKQIGRLLEYASEGAKQDYLRLPDTDPSKQQALEKYQVAEHLSRKFQSLRALEKNNMRYTQKQYDKFVNQMNTLLTERGVNTTAQAELKKAFDASIQENLFNKRRFYHTPFTGDTGFDTTKKSNKISQRNKKVKIEHDGDTVIATFSYNRAELLGTRPFGGHVKIFDASSHALVDAREQAKQFVRVAINDFAKGSKDKPIELYYTNKDRPMPEAALLILMEFKREAIRRGEPFWAKNAQGQLVEITPKMNFTDAEKAYFGTYAFEKPKTRSILLGGKNEANAYAGYKLFKGVHKDKENVLLTKDDRENKEKIFEAMEKHLYYRTGNDLGFKQKRMQEVEQDLGRPRAEAGMRV